MMSDINHHHSLETRGKAVGMVLAGSTTREAAEALGVSQSAVTKWMKKSQQGLGLGDKKRSGRPRVFDKVSKIVIAKSLTKKKGNQQRNFQLKWSKAIFSDESPFEVDVSPNRQNDRIWAHSPAEVPNHE